MSKVIIFPESKQDEIDDAFTDAEFFLRILEIVSVIDFDKLNELPELYFLMHFADKSLSKYQYQILMSFV